MTLSLNAAGDKILPIAIPGDMAPLSDDYAANGRNMPPPRQVNYFGTDELRNGGASEWAALRHGDYSDLLPSDASNRIVFHSPHEEHLYDNIFTGEQYGWLPGVVVHDPLIGNTDLDADRSVNDDSRNSFIYGVYSGRDEGGGAAGNFTNRFPGGQGSTSTGGTAAEPGGVRSLVTGELLLNANGTRLNTVNGGLARNYAIWFGGGLTHMGYSGANILSYNQDTLVPSTWLSTGLTSSGDRLPLKGDIFGDWREEIVYRATNNRLAIITTLSPSDYGIRTLMHDPFYRQGVANTNTGYNVSGFASFYLGDEAKLPPQRTDIFIYEALDKTALAALVAEAQRLDWKLYSAASWAELVKALEDAVDVLEDEYTKQTIIDAAWNTLNGAIKNLKPKVLAGAVPSAWVDKLNGNKNDLHITVTERFDNGTTKDITVVIKIDNNAAGTYQVGSYKVYVNTKGNVQIREIYIVK